MNRGYPNLISLTFNLLFSINSQSIKPNNSKSTLDIFWYVRFHYFYLFTQNLTLFELIVARNFWYQPLSFKVFNFKKINHHNYIEELKFFKVFLKVKDFLLKRKLNLKLVKQLTIYLKFLFKFHQIHYFLFHRDLIQIYLNQSQALNF